MNKRWKIRYFDEDRVAALQSALKIHPLLCRLLVQRGITTFEAARHFFRPSLDGLHSPWLMKDMRKAVERIEAAFLQNEKILIYGDYDVDGTTAVAVVYSFLLSLHENTGFYIPHRYREGYGVSTAGIDYAKSHGYTLIVTLDCGIKAIDKIAYARSMGIDCIVCDHHLPSASAGLPPAVAILNPKQQDCPYPYRELSGCGIGFKLIAALAEKKGLPPGAAHRYLDLVAISIAADIVPMTGENRVLAFYGLRKVNEDPLPGIRALMELSGLKSAPLTIRDLVFMIAPRINAAGRMDDAKKAVQLFIEADPEKALHLAGVLHTDNSDRKEMDSIITREALAMIEKDEHSPARKTTVLYQPHWHKGVVGIVASRLVESVYRPTIVLTLSNNMVAGSARSVAGFNIYEALEGCKDLLENYGGHFYAAGMTLKPENVNAFRERFEEIVAATIAPEMLIPEIVIDAEIMLKDITPSFYNILKQFEPFGPENRCPVFVARNVTDNGYSRIVKENHIRFVVQQVEGCPGNSPAGSPPAGGTGLTGIGFYLGHKFGLLADRRPFDIAFTIEENEWNGDMNLQLKAVDIAGQC